VYLRVPFAFLDLLELITGRFPARGTQAIVRERCRARPVRHHHRRKETMIAENVWKPGQHQTKKFYSVIRVRLTLIAFW